MNSEVLFMTAAWSIIIGTGLGGTGDLYSL
jgi:hypothetical protein